MRQYCIICKKKTDMPLRTHYYFKHQEIHCHQCGKPIGNLKLVGKCPNCGFSKEESLVQFLVGVSS